MKTLPWTHEELIAAQERLDASIEATERERPNIRPLPPMEEEEAKALILGLAETAATRPLTEDEAFMIGQLLAVFKMAVQAKMLKRPGRYFVFSEDQINQLIKGQ